MNSLRKISGVYPARMVDMGGIFIRQPLPGPDLGQIDPFLLLHHGEMKISPDMKPRHAGVGPHPHRGFSPVTFIFKGGVHHRDSRGNDSAVYAGGVQWMNAGMGLIHSERPPENIQELGGTMEILQLWVNTPARHKMDIPEYFPLQKSEIPLVDTGDPNVSAALVAGNLFGKTGPITPLLKTEVDVVALTCDARIGGELVVPIPSGHNAFIYLLDGAADFGNDKIVSGKNLVLFEGEGESIRIKALENTRALLLSGKPIGEKVASHGPFVMNDETQLLVAMRDYQMGKMGVLIED